MLGTKCYGSGVRLGAMGDMRLDMGDRDTGPDAERSGSNPL